VRPLSLALGDASRDDLDRDAPHIRALELFCVRAGIKVLSLSVRGTVGIGDAIAVHRPNMVVIAGGYLSDDAVARWAYSVRLAAGAVPVAVFRRDTRVKSVRTTGTITLPSAPGAAQRRLVELAEEQDRPVPATAPATAPPGGARIAPALRRFGTA
jgi:hypothetical protein